jgi:CHAD domain-containing protein
MAFHIRPDESVAHGLRRVARKELASARDGLERSKEPGEDAIHEARKSVKKVRAVADVVKNDNGHRLAGARKRLQRVNRVLTQSRDADAMTETLSKLLHRQPRLLSEHTHARLRLELSNHRDSVARAADREDAWKDVARRGRNIARG